MPTAQHLPDQDRNATTHYREAFALLPKLTDAENRSIAAEATVPLTDAVRELINRGEPAFAAWKRGSLLRYCDWGPEPFGSNFEHYFDFGDQVRLVTQLGCL